MAPSARRELDCQDAATASPCGPALSIHAPAPGGPQMAPAQQVRGGLLRVVERRRRKTRYGGPSHVRGPVSLAASPAMLASCAPAGTTTATLPAGFLHNRFLALADSSPGESCAFPPCLAPPPPPSRRTRHAVLYGTAPSLSTVVPRCGRRRGVRGALFPPRLGEEARHTA